MGVGARHHVPRPAGRSLAFRRLAVFSREQPFYRWFSVAVIYSRTTSFEGAERSFCGLDQLSIP